MPRARPARLTIDNPSSIPPSPYIPSVSSYLTIPTSPTSPLTPLHPPARLYLRTLDQPTPTSPVFLAQPPPMPRPWVWTCHLCHITYSLSVTRRCLEDGHFFCTLSMPFMPPSSSTSGSTSSPRARAMGERKKRKHRQTRGCRTEFDYAGWDYFNAWRREVRTYQAENMNCSPSDYVCGINEYGGNCWEDCDFPSECHHERQILRATRPAIGLARNKSWEREVPEANSDVPKETLATPRSQAEEMMDVNTIILEDEAQSVDLSVGNIVKIENVEVEMGKGGLQDEVGVKEEVFVEKMRKRQKNKQLKGLTMGMDMAEDVLSTSPLKEQFSPDDVELSSRNTGSMMSGFDAQMLEVLATRSDYLRKDVDREANEFGDEEWTTFF